MKLMNDWRIIDVYQERAAEAIEFQYTYWPDPDNRTARGQEFINVCITVILAESKTEIHFQLYNLLYCLNVISSTTYAVY